MSPADASPTRELAPVFAALGDPLRLELVARLGDCRPHSITELSQSLPVTRQAVRKHLQVLEDVRIVTGQRTGREHHFCIEPDGFAGARDYLERASAQWDDAIGRLRAFVENGERGNGP